MPTVPPTSNQNRTNVYGPLRRHVPPSQTMWPQQTTNNPGKPVAPPAPPAHHAPNPPSAPFLTQGTASDLAVTWAAPAVDSTHDAATAFALRSSHAGTATWTTVSGVTSPFDLSGLAAGMSIDVQIQSSNSTGASDWSSTSTLATGGLYAPNMPGAPTLAQGAGTDLTVTWATPAVDNTHNAATAFAVRSSPAGAAVWTTVPGVTSPFDLSGLPSASAIDVQVQSSNVTGASSWSASSTLTTATVGPFAPNVPTVNSVAPPPDGTTTKLTITWTAPMVDGTHGAATGYNCRWSPHGAGTWTTVTAVTSPYTLTGLAGGTAIDVEVQATNAAASPGAWSAASTGTTWGSTVAQGNLVAAATQVHNAGVAPGGGVNLTATAAPTAVTVGAFAWSASNSVVPTSGLIAGGGDGQPNGWGLFFNAPATAGTYFLWLLAQGAGGVTTGALVTSAITVT